ncbi:unnamed protein product, partial [Scytosiphon promiscuus]
AQIVYPKTFHEHLLELSIPCSSSGCPPALCESSSCDVRLPTSKACMMVWRYGGGNVRRYTQDLPCPRTKNTTVPKYRNIRRQTTEPRSGPKREQVSRRSKTYSAEP